MKVLTTKQKRILINRVTWLLSIVMVISATIVYGVMLQKVTDKRIEFSDKYYDIRKISEFENVVCDYLNVNKTSVYISSYENIENYITLDSQNQITDLSIALGFRTDKYYYYHLKLDNGEFKLIYLKSFDKLDSMLRYRLNSLTNMLQNFQRPANLSDAKISIDSSVTNDISSFEGYIVTLTMFKPINEVNNIDALKNLDFSKITVSNKLQTIDYYYEVKAY